LRRFFAKLFEALKSLKPVVLQDIFIVTVGVIVLR